VADSALAACLGRCAVPSPDTSLDEFVNTEAEVREEREEMLEESEVALLLQIMWSFIKGVDLDRACFPFAMFRFSISFHMARMP